MNSSASSWQPVISGVQ